MVKSPVPEELTRVLARDPAAMITFKRLPPSHQQQYVDWIREAKKSTTRVDRAEKTYEVLISGGGANSGSVTDKALVHKLGFTPGMIGRAINAPFNYAQLLAGDASDVTFLQQDQPDMDFVHAFCSNYKDLHHILNVYPSLIRKKGMLWVSWPKRSSGIDSEIDENDIKAVAISAGWIDMKLTSVDDTWGALLLHRARS